VDALPDTTPDITIDPVLWRDGGLCLQLDGRIVPLRLGQNAVTAFAPGWRVEFAYTGFDPICVLRFSSEGGEAAVWIVDAAGFRLGGSIGELDAPALDALRVAAAPRIAQFVSAVLQQPTVALDQRSRAFLRLPEDFRGDVGTLCAAVALPPAQRLLLDASPDQWESEWILSRRHVAALLATPFQDRVLIAAQEGMLSWPSPVDGRTLTVQGSLCSDDFRFAYRLADTVHGLVCYPVVSHHHAATLGLYVPALNLVVIRDAWVAGWFSLYFPSVTEWLVPLICGFGHLLENYFQPGANRIAGLMRGWPAAHLGHQLWNELSGIDWLLRSATDLHPPEWIVPDRQTELWGPIDEIFPQLQGRVDRSPHDAHSAIVSAYKTGACLVRITSEYVSAGLRASLRRSVEADPIYGEVQRIVAGRTRANAPVIMLGLRVENRTLVDLLDFCEELLEFVARSFPGALLVVDGHNSANDGRAIISHGELGTGRSPLAVERQIATHLRRLQVGRDITVVETLGSSIRMSLAWCEHAHCFFSIWGASLAKYRWACNKPGLVITSKWNTEHRGDLHIYDSKEFMEKPTSLAFVKDDLIRDVPDASLLIDVGPGQPSFFNFLADNHQVLDHLSKVVQESFEIVDLPEATVSRRVLD